MWTAAACHEGNETRHSEARTEGDGSGSVFDAVWGGGSLKRGFIGGGIFSEVVMIWLICLVILPLIVALLLRWNSGVGFWVTYADRGRNEELFVSRSHRLRGKPDFVERKGGGFVPVEYKSHQGKFHQAFRNHVIQVLAYCFLLEDVYGRGKVTKGRVVYDEVSVVPNLDKLEP